MRLPSTAGNFPVQSSVFRERYLYWGLITVGGRSGPGPKREERCSLLVQHGRNHLGSDRF